MLLLRSRWAALGAATALIVGAGGVLTSSAASTNASSFVPITPCRLMDTRPGSDNVGVRATPVPAGGVYDAQVTGTNGNCTIPSTATGVTMNVAIVRPTADSFLTVWPSDKDRPLAASLNWVAGQAPTPNAVTAALSSTGRLSFYNLAGNVDLAVDVVGYFEPASSAPSGPRPAKVIWVATSGGDFTSVRAALASITDNDATHPYVIKVAPGIYNEPGGVDMKPYVDLEGSGQHVTTITCACGGLTSPVIAGTSATMRVAGSSMVGQVRQIAIVNTGASDYSVGLWTSSIVEDAVTFSDVAARASGGIGNYAVWNLASSPSFDGLDAVVTGNAAGTETFGVTVHSASSPSMSDVDVVVSGPSVTNVGLFVTSASPTFDGIDVVVSGGASNVGITNLNGSKTLISDGSVVADVDTNNDGTSNPYTSRIMFVGGTLPGTHSDEGVECVGVFYLYRFLDPGCG